jgi:plastocyanin
MKKLLLFSTLFAFIPSFSQMTMNASATSFGAGCNCYQLTPEVINVAGAIWSPNTIDLNNDFDMTFDVYLGTAGIWAADGMGFVLQESSTGIGSLGSGLGYSTPYGAPALSPNNLNIELDLFDNGASVPTDAANDHIAIGSNGSQHHNLVSATTFPGLQELADGAYHSIRIQWDAGFQVIAAYWEGNALPIISLNIDIINTIFAGNPNVYWGWTGGNGGIATETRVCVTSTVAYSQDLTSVCPGLPVQFTDGSTSSINLIDAWSWDFGDATPNSTSQNPTHTYSNPGTYTVTLTMQDGFGCQYSTTSSVTVLDSLTLSMSVTGVSCFGDTNGTGTGAPSTGTSPYSYAWNDSGTQATQTASALAPGVYTITVTDNLGCVGIDSITVSEPLEIVLLMDSSNVVCNKDSTGWATAGITNGTAPYTYLWDDGAAQSTDTAATLTPGTYTVVVTDVNGCTATDSTSITEPPALSVSTSSTPDNGTNNGSIDLTVSGGVGPYTYSWDNSATTEDISALASGTYTVTVTDANGCTNVVAVVVASSVGFQSLSDIGFEVYPNPTTAQFVIQGIGEYQIVITDLRGRVIYSQSTSDNITINLEVESGIYLIKVLKDRGEFVDKLIIQ